jgi:glycosyltransferase involved in cell wall biosynthesis
MPTPVALVMTVYNREQYLAQALDSIIAQTYPHWELLIWDDGSTDSSPNVARQYADKDPRIQLIAAAHSGRVQALQNAIALTHYPYLAYVDSDDLIADSALAKTVNILDGHPNVGVVYSDHWIIDEQNQIKGIGARCHIPYSQERLLVDFMTFQFRLLRREVYDRVGGIDTHFQSAEDYDLCLKLSEITEFYHLAEPLYSYRAHANTISAARRQEQTEYSGKAVMNALARRGLADRYQFSITPTGQFVLTPNPFGSMPLDRSAIGQPQIPKIIHQTWKDANLPSHLAAFQRTWQEHHPDWEYKLWTDAENRAFLAEHFPWFLPIYDSYSHFICRVDAVRYFWLYYYGGVYIDLDFECLSPIDSLVAEQSLVLSLEPQTHTLENLTASARKLSEILSPAWMATVARHPFWEHLWQHLVASKQQTDPLDATGPFLLTRAYHAYPQTTDVCVIPADRLHPLSLTEIERGELLSVSGRQQLSKRALAVHHWVGSWWKQAPAATTEALTADASVFMLEKQQGILQTNLNFRAYQAITSAEPAQPKVSCLMVTKNRLHLAKIAIFCFLQQTYPNKELIIIDNGDSQELEEFIQQFPDSQITHYWFPQTPLTLGELRNVSVAKASGDYLCQWDDDDLSDPLRLELQMAVIQALKADACTLDSLYLWWPHQSRLAKSFQRLWEGTLVCKKEILPTYPKLQRGEDSDVLKKIMDNYRVAILTKPELYLYCFHENNTWDAVHFEQHWRSAQARFEENDYLKVLQNLSLNLPIHTYLQSVSALSVHNASSQSLVVETARRSQTSPRLTVESELSALAELLLNQDIRPLVSCLMVTKNRAKLSKIAVSCFLNQTYSNKELVIIDDGESNTLAEFIQELNHPQITYHRLPSEDLTLGELRNISLAKATGSYVAQWDDDDLSDPERLASQMNAITARQADGCCLDNVYLWWPHQQRLIKSRQRFWEGTLVCRKDIFPPYPSLRRGEDTEIVQPLIQNHRIVALDRPDLYLYCCHQNNTWDATHFEQHWQFAQARFETDRYGKMLQSMELRLPIQAYLKAVERIHHDVIPSPSEISSGGIPVEDSPQQGPKIAMNGINVAACVDEGFGVNEGAKCCLKALEVTQIPYTLNPLGTTATPVNPYRINLIHANPNMLLDSRAFSTLGPRYFDGKYNIGYWEWESQTCFPPQWLKAFQLFDEIWTPSRYSRDAIAAVSPIPVVTIPHSISLPENPAFSREALGLTSGQFIFLFIYDPLSLAERKNPKGVISAFKQAFDRADDRVRLVIKTKGLQAGALEKLNHFTEDYSNIQILNESFTRDRINALLYHCNCYVSLHRSEGFGLTLAEAMFYGKPTIATGFSGNLDFMTTENSLLVDYQPIQLVRDISWFGKGTVWAEPNLEQVSDYMRQVFENPDLAQSIGAKAAQKIRSQLSPQAVGTQIQQRIHAINSNLVNRLVRKLV